MGKGFEQRSIWTLYLLLLGATTYRGCYGFRSRQQLIRTHVKRQRTSPAALSVAANDIDTTVDDFVMEDDLAARRFLIHWRGEKDLGYSKPFRHLEFENALAAELGYTGLSTSSASVSDDGGNKVADLKKEIGAVIHYTNALNYTGNEYMADMNVQHFNEAMQFVSFSIDEESLSTSSVVSKESVIRAIERCSLIHAFYEIVASSEKLEDLSELAIQDGGFSDLYEGGANEKSTWSFRARMYSPSLIEENNSTKGRGKRYSSRTRSMKIEKDGLQALKPLLIRFGGRVNLENPECKVYVFDGLEDKIDGVPVPQKILARRIAAGPKVRMHRTRVNL